MSPAHVVKLVDTQSSGGCAFGRGGSNPLMRTFPNLLALPRLRRGFFYAYP